MFDRYWGKDIASQNLPQRIDLGRFCEHRGKELLDLTNSNSSLSIDQYINQELLSENNYSVQKLFQRMRDKESNDWLSVNPIMQKTEIHLTPFEKHLNDYLSHLEEIARQPHYLLDRSIEKVPTSRAKRIPSKSYQYLACHTEDWNSRSIVHFKPSKVLNEELDVNYNVYENQLFAAFIQRTLVYLSGRIKETADLQEFLAVYQKLLSNRSDENGWWRKIERNLTLIGSEYEYEDDYTQKTKTDNLSTTAKTLRQLKTRLCTIQLSELYQSVDLRSSGSIQLRNTNVLVGHKHYRYLRDLWQELGEIRTEQTEEEKIIYEQETIQGLRSYARAALLYTCKVLDYSMQGNALAWKASHLSYPSISFEEKMGVFYLTIGSKAFRFVTIANNPYVQEDELEKADLYLLAYNAKVTSPRVIPITPMDADTIERIGIFIKSEVLRQTIAEIQQKYKIPSRLYNFIPLLGVNYIDIHNDYTYTYKSFPDSSVKEGDVMHKLAANSVYTSKTHPDRRTIENEYKAFIGEFNTTNDRIKRLLYCPNCCSKYRPYDGATLAYIQCSSCGFILNSSKLHVTELYNVDDRYKEIAREDWGMDYIKVTLS